MGGRMKSIKILTSALLLIVIFALCGVMTSVIFKLLGLTDINTIFFGISFHISAMVAGLSAGAIYLILYDKFSRPKA